MFRAIDEDTITDAVIEQMSHSSNERLKEIMVNSFTDVVAYAKKHNVHNRMAAYMLALDRVAFAIKLRGIYA